MVIERLTSGHGHSPCGGTAPSTSGTHRLCDEPGCRTFARYKLVVGSQSIAVCRTHTGDLCIYMGYLNTELDAPEVLDA